MSTLKVNTILSETPTVNITDGLNVTGVSTVANITATNVTATNIVNSTQLSHRNMVINGAMQIWQRSTSISVSEGNNEGITACDRFGFEFGNASAGAATISQSTDVPTNLGFPYSFKIDVTTLNDNSAANTQIRFPYRFEAQDILHSDWKYNDPNSFLTISFYFKSNKSGTNKLPVQIRTFDGTAYFYIAEITQSDTNWNRYTLKVPGNANLTFDNDSNMGLEIAWYFAVGTTYHTTADTWGTTQKHGTSNSTNYFNSTSNDMFITGVQIESTTNGIATPFEHRSYADQLVRCQRYYQTISRTSNSNSVDGTFAAGTGNDNGGSGGILQVMVRFQTTMRTTPTMTQSGTFSHHVSGINVADTTVAFSKSFIDGVKCTSTQTAFVHTDGFCGELTSKYSDTSTAFINAAAEL